MRVPVPVWVAILLLLFAAKYAQAEPYKPEAGPYKVEAFLLDLEDTDRKRTVPIKVYQPVQAEGPRPIVLVSHGLGGSREGLSYLGNHWASHGYICVHLQHAGSDETVWRDVPARDRLKAMRQAAMNPGVAIERAKDVPFVLEELQRMSKDANAKLHNKLDMEKIGFAGHSFGAWSAMAAAGMPVGGKQYSDERIQCTIPLSPPVSSFKRQHEKTYGSINIPALFMTGTLDTSPINNTTAEERLIPYKFVPGVSKKGQPKYQINFDGADHMTFSGETKGNRLLRKADPKTDPIFHGLILQSTTAFLDAYLLKDKDALAWLNGGGFVQTVGKHGAVSMDAQ